MQHVKEILAGLAIFIVVAGFLVLTIGGGMFNAYQNNLKQQKMTELCVAEGHDGWSGSEYNGRLAGCFNR